MWSPRVKISYVDGDSVFIEACIWPDARSEGVDSLEVWTKGPSSLGNQSIYWCYQEGYDWVFGGGPVGYGDLCPEIVVHPDGSHEARQIDCMPDLAHSQVKLGHWRPE